MRLLCRRPLIGRGWRRWRIKGSSLRFEDRRPVDTDSAKNGLDGTEPDGGWDGGVSEEIAERLDGGAGEILESVKSNLLQAGAALLKGKAKVGPGSTPVVDGGSVNTEFARDGGHGLAREQAGDGFRLDRGQLLSLLHSLPFSDSRPIVARPWKGLNGVQGGGCWKQREYFVRSRVTGRWEPGWVVRGDAAYRSPHGGREDFSSPLDYLVVGYQAEMARKSRNDAKGDMLQGTLDMMILRTVLLAPAHGHTIAHAIEKSSDSVLQVEHGSLYPALHRLEDQGLIASFWGTSEANRRAKYYRITPHGRKHLLNERGRFEALVRAVTRVLGPAEE